MSQKEVKMEHVLSSGSGAVFTLMAMLLNQNRGMWDRRFATALATLLLVQCGYAEISGTTATVRQDNSLLVDIHITTAGSAARLAVTYQADGVEPLVSRWTPVDREGVTKVTVGRLRANRTYTYSVRAIDNEGGPAGAVHGSFTTGSLPVPLSMNSYTLQGHFTEPLVILSDNQPNFRGYVALDLQASDAPQIVWYYVNPPSTASGVLQVDTTGLIIQEQQHGNFIFADGGSGPGPLAADVFYRELTPDGKIRNESPSDCNVMPPAASPAPAGWIWGQGNDTHEQLLPGADGVRGTVLHLGKMVKDPFFDAGFAPQGTRLQAGTAIRRWNLQTGTDEMVWDPFKFLNPFTERTEAANSDPGASSSTSSPFPCAGASLQIEEWMHANSLQVAPTGVILMSVRHLDTVIAISPQFDRIAWRIGRFGSDFSFPNPSDRFYHEHFVRMLDNGNLLLLDNGNGRPAAEGGLYTRALELSLDWETMTATKVWEYRHQTGSSGVPVYKYADKVGVAQRLGNGNTLVWYGADIDPATLLVHSPETFTLVEADASAEARAVGVLDVQIPPYNGQIYRALPVTSLFGETAGTSVTK
jgi:hypothetical protein